MVSAAAGGGSLVVSSSSASSVSSSSTVSHVVVEGVWGVAIDLPFEPFGVQLSVTGQFVQELRRYFLVFRVDIIFVYGFVKPVIFLFVVGECAMEALCASVTMYASSDRSIPEDGTFNVLVRLWWYLSACAHFVSLSRFLPLLVILRAMSFGAAVILVITLSF